LVCAAPDASLFHQQIKLTSTDIKVELTLSF
jgi:hypothetical protein